MWEWMQQDVPARNLHEEEGGLHDQQIRRDAVPHVIEAVGKSKYCTPRVDFALPK